MKGSVKFHRTFGEGSACSGSGADTGFSGGQPYINLAAYPTRDGSTHVMFSWNTEDSTVSEIVSVKLYFTTTLWNNIVPNDEWHIGDDNPFSDSMDNVTSINMSWTGEGELGEYWWFESGYTVMLAVQHYNNSEKKTGYVTWKYLYAQTEDNMLTSASPTLSYDNGKLTIGSLVSGRRILEFRRTDISYGDNTGISDEETLNEMFFTALLNMEYDNPYRGYYYLSNNPIIERWRRGSYTIGVRFNSTRNQSRISSAIDNAIDQINSVMNEFGISFRRSGTSGTITVVVDTEANLYGIDIYNTNYVYGGTWQTDTDSSGNIIGGTVKLASDFQDAGAYFSSYETVAFEELLQCMGAGFDQVEYPYETIHTDFNYYNKSSSMYQKDANILRLVYSSEVETGDPYYEVCRKLNIPKGAYMPSTSTWDSEQTVNVTSFATRGGTYQVRAFIVNYFGEVSGTSNWLTITIPEVQVDPWDWNASNGSASAAKTNQFYRVLTGQALPEDGFSYLVWNDLVDKVAEVVEAYGGTWYPYSGYGKNGCKVRSGDTFSASKYNEVRVQIGSILSTGISDRSEGDEIQGRYITVLTDNINTIISTML